MVWQHYRETQTDGRELTLIFESVKDLETGLNVYRSHDKKHARLFAAAPDLLEVLKAFVEDTPCRLDHHGCCQEHGGMINNVCLNEKAKAAIAKAEGADQ